MREVEPAINVELRRDRHGQDSVVFAFPYRADVVDAVRAIPGRRFDWEAREWWAPRADATAPFVKGVLERFPSLITSPDVDAWLSRAVTGWVGRVTAGRYDGKGAFALETIAGELPEELLEKAHDKGGRLWIPFAKDVADELLERAQDRGGGWGIPSAKAVAEELLEMRGARLDDRALRCAPRLQVHLQPAPGSLSLVESQGESRFKLDVNWDPDTIPAFLQLPAVEAHGRTVPVDPYLLEPLEHYLRTFGVEASATALDVLDRLRREHDAAIEDVRRSRAHDGPELEIEDRLGGELRPFQRAGVAYALWSRRTFLADEQGLGKTVEALATLEADDAYPAVVVCPASLKLNWQREIAHWLPHRSVTVVSGTSGVHESADIVVLNYEIVPAHRQRLGLRVPKALVLDESHYVKNPRAKRTQAVRRLVGGLAPDALRLLLTGTPV